MKNIAFFLGGTLIIVGTFFTFTAASNPRNRCHVPSWQLENWHFLFEIGPYFFISASSLLLIYCAWYILRHSSDIITNIFVLSFSFIFSVFAFASVYFSYGVISGPTEFELINSILANPYENLAEETRTLPSGAATILSIGSQEIWIDNSLEVQRNISSNSMDYIYAALSISIPGIDTIGLEICPAARGFILSQALLGYVFALLAIFLGARFSAKVRKD